MITFREARNKKEIINILVEPRTFYKSYGYPYTPGNRVHIGEWNYIAEFKGKAIGLLQVDKFTAECPLIHGCIIDKLCRPIIVNAAIAAMLDLFEKTSKFKKILATIPANAKHVSILLKRHGFKEEGRITDCVTYKGELVDLVSYTYTFNRE